MRAVLLYPMNALATDQAMRINHFLARPELEDVTAGLYIGEAPGDGVRPGTDRTSPGTVPSGGTS